ncbi:rod shape-determining protein MreD [Microbispora sp. KK1-11]|uniref:rod shape-determining protein MreD n=1 Tax=Microbispora sp. KK1-11 TaxID=2053005 RepID=UPI00115C38D0|nr:rod shape-determining protein MreD [Microbispora sp. KK1-11]TQS27542.1 rod shape-determining protein MreD [Microbispora sp. KK1-11]
MARNLLAALLLFVALVLQVSVVNRLLLSWAPDLVLLTVAALATRRGPVPGAVIGFCGGLAYDLLPPSNHTLGQYALVLCALGYAAGRAGDRVPPVAVAACAVVAPGMLAGLGALIGAPGVTWPVLATAWPRAAICNLVAAPLVLWAVKVTHGGHRRRAGGGELVPSWRRGTA